MLSPEIISKNHSEWWHELGLTANLSPLSSGNDRRKQEAILHILRNYRPVTFASASDEVGSVQITFDQVVEKIADAEQTHESNLDCLSQQREKLGWEQIEAAYSAADANEMITEGRWTDFTKAEATAWCWNLFQYEPQGFVHPGSEVRARAMSELMQGGIPAVFGYPERARRLTDHGLVPRKYRQHKESLGAPTFSAADVSRR